jgi:hypothetical protein
MPYIETKCSGVDAGGGDPLPRQLLDRGADGALQRVRRVQVGGLRPAVDHAGGQHGGVLARAVHAQAGAVGGRPVLGVVLGAEQSRLLQPGAGEDLAGPVEVERFAGVRGAGQRQQLALQVEPGPQHGDHLQRLDGRARRRRSVHRSVSLHRTAFRVESQHPHLMPRLHEPGPDNLHHQ